MNITIDNIELVDKLIEADLLRPELADDVEAITSASQQLFEWFMTVDLQLLLKVLLVAQEKKQ